MKRRKGAIDKSYILLGLIVIVVVSTVIFLSVQLRTDKIADAVRDGEPIPVVFLVSEDDSLLFTELFLYDSTTGKAAIFDIPGEWGDVIDSLGRMERIDILYEYGNPGAYIAKLEDLLAIELPYYIEMSLGGVERVVDLLEGIDLFIANPVEITDDEDFVLLPSGSLTLDGSKIRTFVSYTDPEEADIDRRGRHQKFVQSLLKRIGERVDYLVSDSVFSFLETSIRTNLSSRAFESFVKEMQKLNTDYIVLKHVHGDRVMGDDQELLFPHRKGNLIRESIRQTRDSLANTEIIGSDDLMITLEVLNGTSRSGLSERTSKLFADFGYDVVRFGNADRDDYEHTQVVANTTDIAAAQQVANLIQCSRVNTDETGEISEVDETAVDVTIILGLDFDGRYCKE